MPYTASFRFLCLPSDLWNPILDFALNPIQSQSRQSAKFTQCLISKELFDHRIERRSFILSSVSSTNSLISCLKARGAVTGVDERGGERVREIVIDYSHEKEGGRLKSILEVFELCSGLESISIPSIGSPFSVDRVFGNKSEAWETLSKMSLKKFQCSALRGSNLLKLYEKWIHLQELSVDYHFPSDSTLSIRQDLVKLTYTVHDIPTLDLLVSFIPPSLKILILSVQESIYSTTADALGEAIAEKIKPLMVHLVHFEYYRSKKRGKLELSSLLENAPLLEIVAFNVTPNNLSLPPKLSHVICNLVRTVIPLDQLPESKVGKTMILDWIRSKSEDENSQEYRHMTASIEILSKFLVKNGWEVNSKFIEQSDDGSNSVWHGV